MLSPLNAFQLLFTSSCKNKVVSIYILN
jgi:hypothetical protein